MCVACIVKDIDLDDDDVDEDEEMGAVADQSLWYRKGKVLQSHELHPIDEVFLDKVRKHRQKEVEMWCVQMIPTLGTLFGALDLIRHHQVHF